MSYHKEGIQPQVWVVCEEQVKTEPSSGDGRMMRDAYYQGLRLPSRMMTQDIQLPSPKPRGTLRSPGWGHCSFLEAGILWVLSTIALIAPVPQSEGPRWHAWNCCLPNTFLQELQKPDWGPQGASILPLGLYQNSGQATETEST